MKQRDKQIIDDLYRFRCMSRDDIIDIHFSHLKNPVNSCNNVLKRLIRDKLIDRSTNFYPYVYFPTGKGIKKDSAKIPHFLEIVKVYKDMCRYKEPSVFIVEPKYGKGYMEPDIFAIWKGTPFFIEVQRSVYSNDMIKEKMERYESFKDSGLIAKEHWQPKGKEIFPTVLVLTGARYDIETSFRVVQTKDINQFMYQLNQDIKPKVSSNSIQVKIG